MGAVGVGEVGEGVDDDVGDEVEVGGAVDVVVVVEVEVEVVVEVEVPGAADVVVVDVSIILEKTIKSPV